MKLYAVYVGGEHPAANIEVHDMRFVVAPSLEAAYGPLKQQWWGRPGSLHIDCWSEVVQADGYLVTLRPEPSAGQARLYYVNLGGYDPADFSERHRNIFVVADSLAAAKRRAIKRAQGWTDAHRDDMYEAEQAFDLNATVEAQRLHIHLTPIADGRDAPFACEYLPIR